MTEEPSFSSGVVAVVRKIGGLSTAIPSRNNAFRTPRRSEESHGDGRGEEEE